MDPALLRVSRDGRYLRGHFPSQTDDPVTVLVSTIAAGDLALDAGEGRRALYHSSGIEPARVISFRQTHSKSVAVVSGDSSSIYDADGGIALDREFVLTITVADCLPILLFDRSNGGFGIVHSGWKGTGIVINAVELMGRHFGCEPADLSVLIGPSIGACCYDVPARRAHRFEGLGSGVVHYRKDRHFLDLREANRILLRDAGVTDIVCSSLCTSCNPILGSYRRQGPDRFVRMLAVIGYF